MRGCHSWTTRTTYTCSGGVKCNKFQYYAHFFSCARLGPKTIITITWKELHVKPKCSPPTQLTPHVIFIFGVSRSYVLLWMSVNGFINYELWGTQRFLVEQQGPDLEIGLLKKLLAVTFRQHSSRCLSNTAAITNLGLMNTIWLDKHRSCLRFTKEQFKNCATVNRISVQSEYPQNVFTVPASNHFNRVRSVLHHEVVLVLKDVTLPQQIRYMKQLDYSKLYHPQNVLGTGPRRIHRRQSF